MGAVFTRDIHGQYPVAARAAGMYIYDDTGKAYLDMSGGAAVSCLGHQHPAVLKALHMQLDTMAFAHTAFFTNEPQEKLAVMLAARFDEPGAKVYFLSGGSEANETALKMAWQYWCLLGKPDKTKIISRQHSYHGNTLGALSVTGAPLRRRAMADVLHDWPRTAPCYAYRLKHAGESDAAYGQRAANLLEAAIMEAGPETVAAFIAEPVVGSALGVVPAVEGYFARIREICDRYDILLIADEVMCGTGRMGTFFAHEQDGFLPDIVTIAKGIGGGYQPLAATIVRRKVVELFSAEGNSFDHGHTYVGHATACAAGVAVLETFEQEGLLAAVVEKGMQLQRALEAAFLHHPNVGDIRGRGLFRALEFVTNKSSKKPVANGAATAKKLKQSAMQHGLICYPGSGRIEDGLSCYILLAPPFILETAHIEELVEKLAAVMSEVFCD